MAIKRQHQLIKNIYYMLSYAFSPMRQQEYEKVAGEEFDNIWDLLASILCQGINRQIRRGLVRDYVTHENSLTALRGKVLIESSISLKLRRSRNIACEFDEYEENTLLNQILKSFGELLFREKRVSIENRERLKQNLSFFHKVENIEINAIPWNRLTFGRREKEYELLINICKLISQNLVLSEEKGELKLPTFLLDKSFHYLFEKFVLNYFKVKHPEINACSKKISWDMEESEQGRLLQMLSDIYTQRSDHILIIDTKFYRKVLSEYFGKKIYHSNNLYQIFTYVANEAAKRPHQVDGMLLYAKTEEDITPDDVFIINGHHFWIRTLDLNQNFEQGENSIREQLDRIGELV
jgi:5-methylcytosine-specific restriction enzyme subunit McrC